MYISLGRMLFSKNALLNIIVVFQLGVALIISNILIGSYNKTYQAYSFTENYADNAAFFSPMRIGTETEVNIDYNMLADEGTEIEFLSKIAEGEKTNIFCYGEKTFTGLASQLTAGKRITGARADGFIHCISIGNKYSVGESFTETVGDKAFSFLVTGVISGSAMVISPSRSSSVMRADMLFYEYDAGEDGHAVICSSESLADAVGTYGNALVFGVTDRSAEQLKKTGKVITMAEIRSNSDEELSLEIKSYLPLAICFGLLGFASAVSMAIMNILGNKKVFSVYFVCGMSRKDSVFLNLGYMLWMIFGIIITTLILFIFGNLTGIINDGGYLAGVNNFIFSLGYILSALAITSAMSFAILKPSDISES